MFDHEEGYWPHGIQQTGPLPVVNLYGSEPFRSDAAARPYFLLILTACQEPHGKCH